MSDSGRRCRTLEDRELPLRALKANSRSQWNGVCGADSGPSQGDPGRRAYRPIGTSRATLRDVLFTAIAGVQSVSFVRFRPKLSASHKPLSFDPIAPPYALRSPIAGVIGSIT